MHPEPQELSPQLRAFIDEAPVARGPHVAFLSEASGALEAGSTVLDVGAGDAPYRELFSNHRYVTCDWEGSFYEPSRPVDVTAPADQIPWDDATCDAIVCTQVLEHVPEPGRVLDEFYRLLRPGGHVFITTPLTWYLHELPHDYYRYTSHGLRYLLERAGFTEIEITPMNNSLATIAELLRQLAHITGPNNDGHDEARRIRSDTLARLAPAIESLGEIDSQWLLPISFAARARRPELASD